MELRGQDRAGARGYAMAALLVTIAIMSLLLSVAMPVWRHEAQREKEEELVFRGQQYARAIRLYQMKTSSLPPSVDTLVQGRYIRRKFKDPITNDDFEMIGAGTPQAVPGAPAQAGQVSQPSSQLQSGPPPGGMIGVRSKSKDESIRVYQGRTHYNEWPFIFVQQQPGRGGPGGAGRPGLPGAPGGGRGGSQPGRGGRGVGPGGRGPGILPNLPFPGTGRGRG